MEWSNNSYGALMAMEEARTGYYGEDYEDYFDDVEDYEEDFEDEEE